MRGPGSCSCPPASAKAGFTLLELAISLAIIGVLAGMTMSMASSMLNSYERGQTTQKLNALEDALMEYRRVYNRLPCPADPTLAVTDANYGAEAANAGTCNGGTPAAPYVDATHSTIEGAVPFAQLGIPAALMYDGWGRKFAYTVNKNVTAYNAMVAEALLDQCGITVLNAGGGLRTTGAVYVLVSFGSDGHGAYTESGTRYNGGSTNANELIDCHCDQNLNPQTFTSTYVQQIHTEYDTPTNIYDDQVRFKERLQLLTYDDTYMKTSSAVCSGSPGFRVNGATTSAEIGLVAVGDVNCDGIPDLVIGEFNPVGNPNVYVIFGTSAGFANPLALPPANSTIGITITRAAENDSYLGTGGSAVGDINKDGCADILMTDAGVAYVLYGSSSLQGGQETYDLGSLTACQTFSITGTSGNFPTTVAIGDVNGDGIGDMVITDNSGGTATASGTVTFTTNPTNNETIVLNGVTWKFKTSGASGTQTNIGANLAATLSALATNLNASGNGSIDVATYSASATVLTVTYKTAGTGGNSYTLAKGTAGSAVSGATLSGGVANGAASVVFGQNVANNCTTPSGGVNGTATTINATSLTSATNPKGSTISNNSTTGTFGIMKELAIGDVNNDGIGDIMISDENYGSNTGRLIIVAGQATWPSAISVASLAGIPNTSPACSASSTTCGTIITNAAGNGSFCSFLASGGDITGDSITDIVWGGDYCPAYVIKGGAGNFTLSTYPIASGANNKLTAGTAFTITDGSNSNSGSPGDTFAIADVNGDGIADLIIGNSGHTANGSVWVLFGGSGLTTWDLNSSAPTGTNGFRIDCSYSDSGRCGVWNGAPTVAGADLNHDGIKDIIIGVPQGSVTGANEEGYVYTLFGKSSGWTATYPLSTIY